MVCNLVLGSPVADRGLHVTLYEILFVCFGFLISKLSAFWQYKKASSALVIAALKLNSHQ